jgi:hypothetical protein
MTDTSTDPGPAAVGGDEPVDLVPVWLRTGGVRARAGLRRHAPRRLDLAALVLGLASLVPLTWLLLRGSFYIDDLRAQSYAAGRAWWPFVVQSNGTHLTPGARTIDWLQVTFAPLDHGVAVAITVAVRALLLLGAWRLLRLLFGARWLLLVPLAIIATTPALVPPSAWYRQSITALVAAVALVWATDQHVRWLRDRRARHLVGAVAWVAAGLAFHEQSAAIVPWLFTLTLVLPLGPEAARERPRLAALVRVWPAWAAYAALLVAYAVAYVAGPFDHADGGEALTVGLVLAMAGHHLLDGLATGLLGGPWRWAETSKYYGIADAPAGLAVASLAVFGGLFAWAALRDWRRTVRAVVLLVVVYVACAAPIAAGRLPLIGTVVGLEYRFWPILVVPVLLCVLLAFLPTSWEGPAPLHVGAVSERVYRLRLAAGAALVMAVAAGTVVSTLRWDELWHQNPTGTYVSTLRSALDRLPPGVALLPTAPPNDVMPGWVQPGYDTRDLIAPVDGARDAYGASGKAVVADDSGHLVSPVFHRVVGSGEGPVAGCGWPLKPGVGSLSIPLARPAPYYRDAGLNLAMIVSQPTRMHVQFRTGTGFVDPDERQPLDVRRAPYRVFVRLPRDAVVTGVRISVDNLKTGVCVLSSEIDTLDAGEGS